MPRYRSLHEGWLLRTDETTSRMALAVTAASACLRIRSGWLAPATMRCALLIDKVAVLSCAAIQAALLPLPAVRTTSGLSPKSVRVAASCSDALAWRNSSMVLRRLVEVAIFARTSAAECGGRVP